MHSYFAAAARVFVFSRCAGRAAATILALSPLADSHSFSSRALFFFSLSLCRRCDSIHFIARVFSLALLGVFFSTYILFFVGLIVVARIACCVAAKEWAI